MLDYYKGRFSYTELRTMPFNEYATLNKIMYEEYNAKLAEKEAEEQAARDDEISKQKAYGAGQEHLSVLTDEQKAAMSAATEKAIMSNVTENDIEQVLEEEGLI